MTYWKKFAIFYESIFKLFQLIAILGQFRLLLLIVAAFLNIKVLESFIIAYLKVKLLSYYRNNQTEASGKI